MSALNIKNYRNTKRLYDKKGDGDILQMTHVVFHVVNLRLQMIQFALHVFRTHGGVFDMLQNFDLVGIARQTDRHLDEHTIVSRVRSACENLRETIASRRISISVAAF